VTQALTPKDVKKFGRFTHLGVGAAVEAYIDAGLDAHRAQLNPERMGVDLGVGSGGLPEMEAMHDTWKAGGFRKISPFFILQIAPEPARGPSQPAARFPGAQHECRVGLRNQWPCDGRGRGGDRAGDVDVMLAGGAESTVTPLAIGAFAQMRALSTRNAEPTRASRPYDKDRDGFVLSEGSVVFVLEEREQALRRGARIYAELRGYGASADAYHLSSLAPGAEGSVRSMRAALARSGLAAGHRLRFGARHVDPGWGWRGGGGDRHGIRGEQSSDTRERREVDDWPLAGWSGSDGRLCRGAGGAPRGDPADH
jgi:3-oxoacyl-[acyl-carrier-protein] synthase II